MGYGLNPSSPPAGKLCEVFLCLCIGAFAVFESKDNGKEAASEPVGIEAPIADYTEMLSGIWGMSRIRNSSTLSVRTAALVIRCSLNV
jgi:hypothetical protein